MENDDFNNNKVDDIQLPIIQLPEGVSPADIAKVINNVLLERVVSETNPWGQWILLGALEILANRGVPFLDKQSLESLQVSSDTTDTGYNISTDEPKQLKDLVQTCSLESRQLSHKHTQTSYPIEEVKKQDFGMQVTPRLMKLTSNKWIQVHICKTTNTGTQVAPVLFDAAIQTSSEMEIEDIKKNFSSVDTQTVIILTKEAETQYTVLPDSMTWKLIPLSDLPKKKRSKQKKDKGHTKDNNSQKSSTDSSPVENADIFPGREKGTMKMFHGRPLIGKGSTKAAADIPANPVCDSLLYDPRAEDRER